MVILEDVVCGAVELYSIFLRCVYNVLYTPICIKKGRLDIRNTSLYNQGPLLRAHFAQS